MRPRQLAAVALLVLVAGCGPSAEEQYKEAAELYETEQKELDRMLLAKEACQAHWQAERNKLEVQFGKIHESVLKRIELGKNVDQAEIDKTRALSSKAFGQIDEMERTELREHDAVIDSQLARVEKAKAARDAADKARK